MYRLLEETDGIVIELYSIFENVDKGIRDLDYYVFQGKDEDNIVDFNLMMREIINNAIEHGNKKIPEKIIKIECKKIEDDSFLISVEDEGEGFNHRGIDYNPEVSPDSTRSRGFVLINKIADNIKFNESGNKIIIDYKKQLESTANITRIDGKIIFTPNGDVTSVSTSSNNLKSSLKELQNESVEQITFDFQNVKEVDSIGLSLFVIFARNIKKQNPDCLLKIDNIRPQIIQLFLFTGLDKFFVMF